MKKVLLSLGLLLCGMVVSAQGIVKVGANITVLPSSRYSGSTAWSAATWVYNSQMEFGEGEKENPLYNNVFAEPPVDANGHEWYEAEYDTTGLSYMDDGIETPIVWETHEAPFSSDEKYNGRTSYQWTTSGIMADIYFRRTFTTDQLLSGNVYLACGHDDAPCEYYINGELVWSETDGWDNDHFYMLTDEQKSLSFSE